MFKTARQWVGSKIDQFASFAALRPQPVVAPFRQERAPYVQWRRHITAYVFCVFLGLFYGFWGTILPSDFAIYLAIPAIFLIGLILWLLPDRESVSFETVRFFLIFYTLTVIIWPNYLALNIGGLPWISLRRVAGIGMIITFLFLIASSSQIRNGINDALKEVEPVRRFAAFFFITMTISLFFSDNLNHSYKQWFNNLYAWSAVFFVSIYAFLTPKSIHRWMMLLMAAAIIVAAIGVREQQIRHVIWAEDIPQFLQVEIATLEQILRPKFRNGLYRSQSVFSQSLSLAQFLALTSIIVTHFMMTARGIGKAVLLALVQVVIIICIVYTRARLGLIGMIWGHAVYALIWGLRNHKQKPSNLIGAAITYGYPAAMLAFAFLVSAVDALRIRILGSGTTQYSDNARDTQWAMMPDSLLRSPIFGHGQGMGPTDLGYVNFSGMIVVDSFFLVILLDYGIIGFICYYGMIAYLLYTAWHWAIRLPNKLPREKEELGLILPLGIMLFVLVVIQWVLSQADNDSLLFMVMGAIVALNWRLKREWGDKEILSVRDELEREGLRSTGQINGKAT